MQNVNKRGLLFGLVFLVCVPYLLSIFGLILGMPKICEPESLECIANRRILIWTVFYLAIGMLASWWGFKERKYWRVAIWIFLFFSTVAVVYDFYRSPGASFLETVQIKLYSFQMLFEKGEAKTGLFLFWKDFLNPVFLLLVALVATANNNENQTGRLAIKNERGSR